MAKHSFWDFQVEIDESATEQWYGQAEAWGCACEHCCNFQKAVREERLPVPVREMLCSLGIPPEKATYVCCNFSDEQGLHYQFSYRIAGCILAGHAGELVSQEWGGFRCGQEPYPYGAPGFPQPHFDMEFYVTLPWVPDQPE